MMIDKQRAMLAFREMCPNSDKEPLVIDGQCDGLVPQQIFDLLQAADASNGLVVVGNDEPGNKINVDTYDLVSKFAEDHNFSKIRQRKEGDGSFAVIMVPSTD